MKRDARSEEAITDEDAAAASMQQQQPQSLDFSAYVNGKQIANNWQLFHAFDATKLNVSLFNECLKREYSQLLCISVPTCNYS